MPVTRLMKKLMLVIFISFGSVYYFMDIAFWSKINPDHFEKTETQARFIIDAKHQQSAQISKTDSLVNLNP